MAQPSPYTGPPLQSDETYESSLSYESTLALLQRESLTTGYDLKKELFVMDTEVGIFIRSVHEDWCIFFDSLCEVDNEELKFRPLRDGEWEELMEKYPKPDRSFGNLMIS